MVTAFAAVPSPAAALTLLGHMQARTGGLLSSFELMSRAALELVLKNIPNTRDPLSAPSPWYVLMEVSGGAGTSLEALTQSALEDAMADELVTRRRGGAERGAGPELLAPARNHLGSREARRRLHQA